MRQNFLKTVFASSLLLASALLTACGGDTKAPTASMSGTGSAAADRKIVIGVSSTPHGVIIDALQEDFKKAGLEVEKVVFEDYVTPNHALADGSLDANYFQHEPYFKDFTKEHNLNLVNLGFVHIEPMGLYSTKYKSLDELQEGDEILVPNDVTNGARALRLLEKNGLLKLSAAPDALDVTVLDISENPKNLKITALNAPTIPTAYKDVAGGIINSNFLISAGIDPATALVRESGENNPYANLVAVRQGEEKEPKFQKLMEILHSEKTKKLIEELFHGEILAA